MNTRIIDTADAVVRRYKTRNPGVLPDRCPDCGAQTYKEKPAVRPASNNEIDELLRIRAEDKEDTTNEST